MTFAHVGVQHFHVALLAGFDEIAKVISAATEFLDDIEILVVRDAVGVLLL